MMSPRTVGILMIAMGLVSLALASLQHRRSVKKLREQCPDLPVSLAALQAGALAGFGSLALVGAIVR